MQSILSLLFLFTFLIPKDMQLIYNFSSKSDANDWWVVDDRVMGGISGSRFTINEEGNGLFSGTVSLENNGGFCSVRHAPKKIEINGAEVLRIRLKGDGKKYQVRIKTRRSDYYSYVASFQTTGEWQTVEVVLKEMYPSFRGRKLNSPNFSAESFSEITFLIGNKKAESFKIEFDKIELI